MYLGRTVFAQVMDSLPLRRFHTCVKRYDGNHKVKSFTCLDQFRVGAQVSQCSVNFRQWGIAVNSYAADNKGALPSADLPISSGANPWDNGEDFVQQLQPYMDDWRVWFCPLNQAEHLAMPSRGWDGLFEVWTIWTRRFARSMDSFGCTTTTSYLGAVVGQINSRPWEETWVTPTAGHAASMMSVRWFSRLPSTAPARGPTKKSMTS